MDNLSAVCRYCCIVVVGVVATLDSLVAVFHVSVLMCALTLIIDTLCVERQRVSVVFTSDEHCFKS